MKSNTENDKIPTKSTFLLHRPQKKLFLPPLKEEECHKFAVSAEKSQNVEILEATQTTPQNAGSDQISKKFVP